MFIKEVFRLHGTPLKLLSDRDSKLTSKFWSRLAERLGIKQAKSTAYHAQTDGQTEKNNRTLEEMLRHFISPQMTDWDQYLPMLEFAYNSSEHAATGYTPFHLNNGLNPLTPASSVIERGYKVPAAEHIADSMLLHLRRARMSLERAKLRAAQYYNTKHNEVTFNTGDKVLLKTAHLQLKLPGPQKLGPKWVGPYKILERVGKVSYRLELPANLKIHNVFHVSLLGSWKSATAAVDPDTTLDKYGRALEPPLPVQVDGQWEYWVESILKHTTRWGKRQFLVKWLGYGHEHNTWEPEQFVKDTQAFVRYAKEHL
jgi:hypothetical protein